MKLWSIKGFSVISNFLLVLLSSASFCFAKDNSVVIRLGKPSIRIQVITPSIIRVTHTQDGKFSERKSLSALPVKGTAEFHKSKSADTIIISTSRIDVLINEKNGEISFKKKGGDTILTSLPGDTSSFSRAVYGKDTCRHITQRFRIKGDEGLFGLGQFEDGVMNFRGRKVIIAQANRVAVNPFLVSTKGYGIFWDNYSWTEFEESSNIFSFYSEAADEIDYYLIAGESIDDAVSGYRTLTGKAPMFGKWAYGYWQSKERYMSSDEMIGVVKEYRRREIPFDNIIQDWQYWGEMDNFSGMSWDSTRFKNPKEMMDTLHSLNAHMIASIWPAFGPTSGIYKEMEKNNLLFSLRHWSGGKVYDAYSPLARKIYWKHLKKAFPDNNIDGYWMDGSEPEFRCTDDRFATAATIKEYADNYLGSGARYLNPYSLMHTMGVYENQRALDRSKRVFILTRSAFAGQQRYASVTWSGDIFASWNVFRNQIAAGINFSMSGIPYWTTDIGAFITAFQFPEGVKDESYKELYVRWFQFGAFCPIFRAHGTNTPREVWQFGEKGSWAYDALIKADRLRYRLMPYIYSTAWKVTSENYTMMRGLPMDFPQDREVYPLKTEYMFGPSILAAPVTKAIYHTGAARSEDIESNFFLTKDGRENGLNLEVYKGTEFDKQLMSRRFDASQLGWSGCLPESLDTTYSVRMEGKLLSDKKGEYRFVLLTDGGVRFWLDNKLLIDRWDNKEKNEIRASISLEADKKYDIKIEHRQFVKNNALLKINWIKPEDCSESAGKVKIYLPSGAKNNSGGGWFDFWTGRKYSGGKAIERNVPVDEIPLYIPEGSIIPVGPEIKYTAEKAADPLELRVYAGKDGHFTLYEDEGDGYNYEKGIFATIDFSWNEAERTLTIGSRKGKFPGMLKERTFNIVLAGEGKGCGIDGESKPDKTVRYGGKEIKIKL